MQTRIRLTSLAAVLLAFVQMAPAGDTLESVEKTIAAEWEKHKSLSANLSLSQQMEMGGGRVTSTGTGTFEYLRKGDKELYRLEMATTTTQAFAGNEQTIEQKVLSINDGEFVYNLTDGMGKKIAAKSRADKAKMGGGKAMFKQLREEHELTLLPDQELDGHSAYVIEAVPKKSTPMAIARTVYYLRQDTGVMMKSVALNADGKAVQTMTFSEFKINPTIAPERFVFKAPEGVTVLDRTQ